MIIRKIRKNEIVSRKKLMKRVLIAIVLIVLGKWILSWIMTESSALISLKPDQVGETVRVQGYLSVDNKFPHYTHSIIDEKWSLVGVKSVSVNLNAYKGKIEVVGKLEKFLKTIPVVEVQTIKLPDQWLIIKDNIYYFTDKFLYIDFSSQEQLSAQLSGNDVVILFAGKPIVSIQRFLCAQILKGKTCEALINEYHTSQKDNFDSYQGYTFYKHTNNVRTTFDGDLFGYVFKNIDDDMMLNISSMIHLINQDFIIQNKLPVIQAKCTNEDEYIKTIETSRIQYGNPRNISLMLKGQSNKKHAVQCTINFDTWNERTVTKSVFTQQ